MDIRYHVVAGVVGPRKTAMAMHLRYIAEQKRIIQGTQPAKQ